MNEILDKFREVLDNKLNVFFEKVSKKFSIDKDKLVAVWNDQMSQPDEKLPGKAKKSFYQMFFSIKRIELKEKDPTLNFGELSKKISKLWNSMSKQEQNEWIQKNNMAIVEETNYKNMKISDLRSLCSEKGVSAKGSKVELIQSLSSKKKVPPPEDESLHISDGVLHQKRASIEIPVDNDQEEDEFIFEDDEDEDNDDDSLVEGVEDEDEDFDGDEEI